MVNGTLCDAPGGGDPHDGPLAAALERFKADRAYWDPPDEGPDRDAELVSSARTRGAGRDTRAPIQFTNLEDVWGGGLRRMAVGDVGPRREDDHYYDPRYVPIGFARFVPPVIDPEAYRYYRMSGWRVAVPRTVPSPEVRALLLRIYQYGPESAGYARLGDTLVPAILGPGDRQTLAQTETRYGAAARKYPMH